jgi:hypothetical protein
MQRARTGRRVSGPISLLSIGVLTFAACSQGPGASSASGGSGGSGSPASSGSGGSGAATAGASTGGTSASGTVTGGATGSGASSGVVSSGASAGASGGAGSSSGTASGSGASGAGGSGSTSGSSGSGNSGDQGGSGAASGAASSGSTASSCSKANAACIVNNTGCNLASYYLYDNQWNCGPKSGNDCGPESAYGCANADGTVSFVTTSDQPDGNTAVLTYPAVQSNFSSNPALNSFKSITSSYTETSPHVGDYEVAYDCWFNNQANEVMVWVDNYNQVPAGKKVATGVTVGGHSWDVWWVQSSGYLAFNITSTLTAGTVDLLALFKYAVMNAWLPATSTVSQLAFGIEVCSTGGNAATFTIDEYSLTAN